MERMVNRRLMDLLEERKLLDQRQFAFRLASFGEVVRQSVTDGLHADIAYSMWRRIIMPCGVTEYWSITGNMGHFLSDYLSNRTFRVGIGAAHSDTFPEDNGVPQRSVFAVTLFLVSMTSLFTSLPAGIYVFVYADDIVLVATGGTTIQTRRKCGEPTGCISRL
ncbi:uncharacterized protein LOC131680952 [Topomyia yanbarensis]|uniref:uncharacterized protein LOC131680952 n=1 Tax=Topomyia yanbarensis TaxID=2498891 RepID=UPI00273ABCA4|nr:uncharacterized protein LOC131680952 [Topomyia yanbarensis]